MRIQTATFASAICLLTISLLACDAARAHTSSSPEPLRPEDVTSFDILYAQNCAGCHGVDGANGPATDLANPQYQALIDDKTLQEITAKGQQGTLMPGFATEAGGPLTDAQVEVIVKGMRERWRKAETAAGAPTYSSSAKPNLQRGSQLYSQGCARCHGSVEQSSTANRPGPAGSVLDGAFLGLVSDQVLRTTIIAGRPDLGMPDFQNEVAGKPLTNEDVTDLVGWISSQRPRTPGQPYPSPQETSTVRPPDSELRKGK